MSSINTFHNACQGIIYKIIARPVALLVRLGVTPNHVTILSFLGNVGAAVLLISGYLGWGGAAILIASSLDMVDGYIARTFKLESRFGAFFDSVLDRYSELVTLFALNAFLFLSEGLLFSLVCSLALMGSLMVSYVRARAEGLGIECKVGLMQRPERVVVTAAGCIIAAACESSLPLIIALAIVAIMSNLTAIARIMHVYRAC